MASYEQRTNKDGTTSHRVRFRHGGRNDAKTFDNASSALEFKAAVGVLGIERALSLLATPTPATRAQVRTVRQQVEHHIDHLTGVTDGTRAKYRKIADTRFAGTLGSTLLEDLTRDDVARWVNAQHGAPKTIANAHSLLSGALSSAMRDDILPGNVAKGVKLPKRDQDSGEHVYLEADELATLLDMLAARWRPFPLFLVGTGIRFGEAAALTVGDLDVRRGQARIRQAWKDGGGGAAVLGPPKTRKSRRTVAIPPPMLPGLAALIGGRAPAEYVFTNTRGNPIHNGPFHESVWQPAMPAMEAATGKRPRVHDLRHTYAAWAIRTGTPLPVIQRQMGHESIQTTVDTYGHLVRADLDALAVGIGANLPLLEA